MESRTNRGKHCIGIIQHHFSIEELEQIDSEIINLNEILTEIKVDKGNLDLQINSSVINEDKSLPLEYYSSTLAIKIDRKNNYIEIASNTSLDVLLKEIPSLKDTLIYKMINDATQQKNNYLLRENNCLGKYKNKSTEVRAQMQSLQKVIPPIDFNGIKKFTDNIIIVDEHGYAVASYADSMVFIGTKDLQACIGIAVINPVQKKAAVAHLDKPTIETYKNSLKEMFDNIIANKENENQCVIYLIGGAHFPKENFGKNTVLYSASLSSETLCCSVMEFIKNNYPQATIITDMFHEKRPSEFGIFLNPTGEINVCNIIPVKKSRNEDNDISNEDNISSFEAYDASQDQFTVKGESTPKIYEENLLAAPVYYEELQESSFDPNFLNDRIILIGRSGHSPYQEIYDAFCANLDNVQTKRTGVITNLRTKVQLIAEMPEQYSAETKLELTKLLIKVVPTLLF